MAPISPVRFPAPIAVPAASAPSVGANSGAESFQSALSQALGNVDQVQRQATNSVDRFLSGEDEEIHKVAMATQQAELNFDLFLQVRNKVVSAYQEVMRMQM